jgi:hypothetical protein
LWQWPTPLYYIPALTSHMRPSSRLGVAKWLARPSYTQVSARCARCHQILGSHSLKVRLPARHHERATFASSSQGHSHAPTTTKRSLVFTQEDNPSLESWADMISHYKYEDLTATACLATASTYCSLAVQERSNWKGQLVRGVLGLLTLEARETYFFFHGEQITALRRTRCIHWVRSSSRARRVPTGSLAFTCWERRRT